MRLVGTVERVLYIDGMFVVLAIVSSSNKAVTASGRIDAVCPGMPFDAEVKVRKGRADRQYGEDLEFFSVEDPGTEWKRTAGVWAWLSSGGGGLELAAGTLINAFGTELTTVLIEKPDEVEQVLTPIYGEFAHDTSKSLVHLAPVIVAAADLGEKGLAWAVGRLTSRYGTYGPFLSDQDLRGMVGQGVISASALAKAGVVSSLADLAVGVCEWECKLLGTDRLSKRYLTRVLAQAVGESAERGVAEGLHSGGLYVVGDSIVPSTIFLGARSLTKAISEITAGRLPSETTLRPGVSCVVAPPGADLSWLSTDIRICRANKLSCHILWPDRRGTLSRLVGYPESRQDSGSPDVVVIMEAHRFSYSAAARLVHDTRSARALVFVGDDRLWCPGQGDRLVGDLVAWGKVPVIRLVGQGASWAVREMGAEVAYLPGVIRADPPPGTLRVWKSVVPSTGAAKVGRTVVLTETCDDVGAGAVGVVVSVENKSIAHVDFETGGVHRIQMWRTASGMPVGWLPGARVNSLWLTESVNRNMWIAALASADTIYVTDEASRIREESREITNSLLAYASRQEKGSS